MTCSSINRINVFIIFFSKTSVVRRFQNDANNNHVGRKLEENYVSIQVSQNHKIKSTLLIRYTVQFSCTVKIAALFFFFYKTRLAVLDRKC